MWTQRKFSFWLLVCLLSGLCLLSGFGQDFGPSLWESGELELLLQSLEPLPDETLVLNAGELTRLLTWLKNERTYRNELKQSVSDLTTELNVTLSLLERSNQNQLEWQTIFEEQSRELASAKVSRMFWGIGGTAIGFGFGYVIGR